jgi:hypothetical protein
MKEEEKATEEAFNGATFAQFFPSPCGRQAGIFLAVFGVVGDNSDGTQHGMNPSDQTEAPIGGVKTDHSWADLIELLGFCQEALCKRSIMTICWGKQKQQRES